MREIRAVSSLLRFMPDFRAVAERMKRRIGADAPGVGSGTPRLIGSWPRDAMFAHSAVICLRVKWTRISAFFPISPERRGFLASAWSALLAHYSLSLRIIRGLAAGIRDLGLPILPLRTHRGRECAPWWANPG
jgi:hypothetical protein